MIWSCFREFVMSYDFDLDLKYWEFLYAWWICKVLYIRIKSSITLFLKLYMFDRNRFCLYRPGSSLWEVWSSTKLKMSIGFPEENRSMIGPWWINEQARGVRVLFVGASQEIRTRVTNSNGDRLLFINLKQREITILVTRKR